MCHLKIDDFAKNAKQSAHIGQSSPATSHFHSHNSLALGNMGMGL